MSTRSLTIFQDDGKDIAVMYRQCDGYPEGHGADLKAILEGHRVVNGYTTGDTLDTAYNTMGCLAAAVVARLKDSIGNIYLFPAGSRDWDEEYRYTVSEDEGVILLKVESGYGEEWETIYSGPVDAFDPVAATETAKA